VTLVTGDRVTLLSADGARARVVPGPGRHNVRFSTHRTGEHLYVVPSDALPRVNAGTLDRRLFDVTGLVKSRRDDARTDHVALIVVYRNAASRVAGSAPLTAAGGRTKRSLPAIDGAAIHVEKTEAAGFWQSIASGSPTARAMSSGVESVWLDAVRQPALDQSVPQIGAPAAWAAGLTGSGVTAAVLDTGVDATHPDLAGTVVQSKNFTAEADGDLVGHGTHVASIIAGSGGVGWHVQGRRVRRLTAGRQGLRGLRLRGVGHHRRDGVGRG